MFRPDADRLGRGWAVLLLAGLCGVLFFYGLNAGDLYRTENLRAVIGAEFLRSGDWIVPRLYGEPLLTKPPGMYAAIALVSWPLAMVQTLSQPSALLYNAACPETRHATFPNKTIPVAFPIGENKLCQRIILSRWTTWSRAAALCGPPSRPRAATATPQAARRKRLRQRNPIQGGHHQSAMT